MNTSRTQRERIIAILSDSRTGLTRNEINRVTRVQRKEIPIQTLCRRLPELIELGYVVEVDRRECSVTREKNAVYRLSASMRGAVAKARKAA